MNPWTVAGTALIAASGWGAAAYLWVVRRQESRLGEFYRAVWEARRSGTHPGLHVVRSVAIGSEQGNDEVTKVGVAPSA